MPPHFLWTVDAFSLDYSLLPPDPLRATRASTHTTELSDTSTCTCYVLSHIITMSSSDLNDIVEAPAHESEEGITVAIRMRPLNRTEGNGRRIWKVLPKYNSVTQTTETGKPLSERVTGRTFFTFDKVFGEEVNTNQVYDSVAKGIVGSVVNGLNGTIFAYGQTSSGKTYTMQGSGSIQEGASSSGGIVHMAANDIFSQIQSQPNRMFLVRASFLEIYNEEVRDLLSDSLQSLPIREDPRRGVFVQSQEEIVTDFESLLKMLFRGEKSRAIASTGMNERSSRSHTIFKITIESREKEPEGEDGESSDSSPDGAVRISTLNLVDLAGSESVRHTGATGERQKEGGMINQRTKLTALLLSSLLTLSRVIVALGQPNQLHINFRDSKLTRILQPSLSGNARMAVVCCATPSELYLEETRSTLQFASRAKLVKTNAQVNEVLDDRSIIRRLQRELAEARRQSSVPESAHLRALENKAASAGTAASEANDKLRRLKASILNASYLFSSRSEIDKENVSGGAESNIVDTNGQGRKRRFSDGGLSSSHVLTPTKLTNQADVPSTAPRKKEKKEPRHDLSPTSELELVREALSHRNRYIQSLRNSLNEQTSQVQIHEDKLKELVSENSGLKHDQEQQTEAVESLKDNVSRMQSNLQATIAEYDTILAEKDTEILSSVQKLAIERDNREKIATAQANTIVELEELQKRFDTLQEERVRGAFEVAQAAEEKEKLMVERETDKQALQDMNGKIASVTADFNEAEHARVVAEQRIACLEACLDEEKDKNQELTVASQKLEENIAESQVVLSDSMQKWEAEKAEIISRLEAVVAERNMALEQSQHFEGALKLAEEKVQALQSTMTEQENSSAMVKRELEARVETISTELTRAQVELSAQIEQRNIVENKCESLEEQSASLRSNLESVQEEKVALEAQAVSQSNEIKQLSEQQDDLSNQLSLQLEKTLAAVEERDQLTKCLGDAKQAQESLSQQVQLAGQSQETLVAELDSTQQKLRELEEVKHGLESTEKDLCCELETVKLQLQECEAKLATCESEKETLRLVLLDSVKQTEHERDTARKELEQAVQECQQYYAQNNELRQEIQAVRSGFVALRTESTSKEIEKAEFVRSIGKLQTEVNTTHSEKEELQRNLNSMQHQMHEIARRQGEQEETYSKVISDKAEIIVKMERDIATLRTLHNEKLEELNIVEIEHSKCIEKIESLESDCDGLREAYDDMQGSVALLSWEKEETERVLTLAEEENMSFKSENDSLKQAIQALREDVTSLETDLVDHLQVKANQETLEVAFEDLAKEKESVEALLIQAKEDANTSKKELDAVKIVIQEYEEVNKKLELDLVNGNTEIDNLKQMMNCMRLEMESVQNSADDQGLDLERLNEELLLARKSCTELTSQLEDALGAVDRQQTEQERSVQELEALKVENVSLQSRCMSLEAEKMASLAELDSTRTLSSEEHQRYEREVESLHESHSQQEAQFKETQSQLVASKEAIGDLQVQLESARSQNANLEGKVNVLLSENESLEEKLTQSEATVTAMMADADSIRSDLAQLSTLKESLKAAVANEEAARRETTNLKQEMEQNVVAKQNAMESLKARESERDEAVRMLDDLYQKNNQLSSALAESLSKELETKMTDEISQLKEANMELKQLLMSANESEERLRSRESTLENELEMRGRELEDTQYRLSLVEEELQQSELAFSEKINESRLADDSEVALLQQEVQSLRSDLASQRSQYEASQAELEKRMGDEQRVLISEGEKIMESLRATVSDLEERLRVSEAEAYRARQLAEEAQDQRDQYEKSLKSHDSSVDSLKGTLSQRESEISELQAELKRVRTDCYAFKESAIEMKDKVRKASRESDRAHREKEKAESELASLQRKMEGLQRLCSEHEAESKRLHIALRDSAASLSELEQTSKEKESLKVQVQVLEREKTDLAKELAKSKAVSSDAPVSQDLRARVDQLVSQIQQKDQRIKKLEAVRLTKEQVESIKKMKMENKKYDKQLNELKKENAALQSQLGAIGTDDTLRAELSELRFDKQALESKLRKFATHCQRLEDDKAGNVETLRSCNIQLDDFQGDLNEAIVSLCDRLASLENAPVPTFDGKELEAEIRMLREKEKSLTHSLTKCQSEVQRLQGKLKALPAKSKDADEEALRKYRFLEQENLQLMRDLKTTKRQLQSTRDELEMLRVNGMDTTTMDFGGALSAQPSSASGSVFSASSSSSLGGVIGDGKVVSNVNDEHDKENTVNKLPRQSVGTSKKRESLNHHVPGLGEMAIQGDDTGECKQS
eukprot:Nitzschia sp. Nitz4//scaffold303_size22340//9389//16391//NITZ4_008567-RA/size22340-processed-gene-0.14-mRNA-1//1//CDS//3329547057//4272//frame0